MLKKYYENPKVTDDIEIDFYTPDADGCFDIDPYKVDNIKIYYIIRDTNGALNEQSFIDQFDVARQKTYLEAQQLACTDPTAENIANADQLRREFEATSIYNTTFYSSSMVVLNNGSSTNPVWLRGTANTNSIITKIVEAGSEIQNGYFKFIWSPNGTIREGDYYICWTWTPNIAGDSFSSYLHFTISSDIANEVSNPSHVINSSQYKNLLDLYLPEMYKMSYAKDDMTVSTLNNFNASVAEGYTVLDNLAAQVVDIIDSNATQEPILGYLANFFGLLLRSDDPTLWRRQIKKAIPNFKQKGTYDGLRGALSDAGITLEKYTQYWQCGTDNIYTEYFKYDGSNSWDLTKTSLAVNPTYFELEKRSVTGTYAASSLSNISITTVDGISTMTWVGAPLVAGDVIKIQYQIKAFTSPELTIWNIVKDLPLADLRDDRDFDYPPKDWNTKLISEDDANFSTVISTKNPFVNYLYFGKVRTKFPYSENVYNMDEYNGSLRDSQNPCDIDKSFLEPCRGFISSYYSLDVGIKELSNERLQEIQDIVAEYTPFHAVLHTLNFSGNFEDFIIPPEESIEMLVQYQTTEFMITGMAQTVFNRAMFLGLQNNAVLRIDLATNMLVPFAMRSNSLYETDGQKLGFLDKVGPTPEVKMSDLYENPLSMDEWVFQQTPGLTPIPPSPSPAPSPSPSPAPSPSPSPAPSPSPSPVPSPSPSPAPSPSPIPVFTGTATGYNDTINLYCAQVNFQSLGIYSDSNKTLLEILGPSSNSGEYEVENPKNSYIGAIGSITEPINTAPFTFNLSNINLASWSFTAAQANKHSMSDSEYNYADYPITTLWDVAQGHAVAAWQVQVGATVYDIADIRNNILLIEDDGSLSNSNATGVSYSLLSPTGTEFSSTSGDYTVQVLGKITTGEPGIDSASQIIGNNGYFYYDSNNEQYKFNSYDSDDQLSFYIDDWDGTNGSVTGKALTRLLTEQVGNFGYAGMKLLKPVGFPTFADPTDPDATETQNYKENYIIEINGKNYCVNDYYTVGPNIYLDIAGELINMGVSSGSSQSINVYRYSKDTIELFGETLTDVSRNGQELVNQVVSYATSMMSMTNNKNKNGINDKINQYEGVSFKIEYNDGRTTTGEIQ